MKLALPGRDRGPIGISIGRRWISAAQIRRGASAPPTLTAALFLPRPVDMRAGQDKGVRLTPPETAELFGVLARAGFRGRAVRIAAEAGVALASLLDLPPRSSGAPINQIARMELVRAHKLDDVGFEFAMWDLPVDESRARSAQTSVLAVACRHDRAEALVAGFDPLPLEVESIEFPAAALLRACRPLVVGGTERSLHALVNVAWDGADVSIVHAAPDTEPAVVYARSLPEFGVHRLFAEMQARRHLADDACEAVFWALSRPGDAEADRVPQDLRADVAQLAEALAPEIERSLAFASGRCPGATARGVLVAGEGGTLRGFAERLGMGLSIPARGVRPADVVVVPPALADLADAGALLTSIGLACSTARPEAAA